jgi:hypothetical protein
MMAAQLCRPCCPILVMVLACCRVLAQLVNVHPDQKSPHSGVLAMLFALSQEGLAVYPVQPTSVDQQLQAKNQSAPAHLLHPLQVNHPQNHPSLRHYLH